MNSQLRVSRKEFIAALNQLKIGLGRSHGEAMLLSHQYGTLALAVRGSICRSWQRELDGKRRKIPSKAVISIIKDIHSGSSSEPRAF